ncbi:outer membrane beta-barrel protein [Kozakia baliensis]|uniref:outer membrane beta-barrel protein n=1 Tax=Kozakia baliensis TaxID=153496 RepID=UPI00089DC35A|nr:outer membrane beta-barrel protein [Kozakia baliensis]
MKKGRVISIAGLFGVCFLSASSSKAQALNGYFPDLGSGADDPSMDAQQQQIASAYAPLGIHTGNFLTYLSAAEVGGYTTNADRLQGGHGSPFLNNQAQLETSNSSPLTSVDAGMSVDDIRYTSRTLQDRTNWTAYLRGHHDFGRNRAALSFTHENSTQMPTDLGALALDRPIPYSVNTLILSDTLSTRGRFSFIPLAQAVNYNFTDLGGDNPYLNQSYRNRVVVDEGVTTRYEFAKGSMALLMLRGTEIKYLENQQQGEPIRDSTGFSIAGGYDFGLTGPIRFRVMGGYQVRYFSSSSLRSIQEPLIQATLVWVPTRLTTVKINVNHGIDDSAFENIVGFTYTTAGISVRHVLARNIILNGSLEYQMAQFGGTPSFLQNTVLQQVGSRQKNLNFNVGAQWLLDRHVSLDLEYMFSNQRTIDSSTYGINTISLSARFAL